MTPGVLMIVKASNLLVTVVSLKDGMRTSSNMRIGYSSVGFDAAELSSLGRKLGSFWFTLVAE